MNLTVTNTYRGDNISDSSIWVWTDSKWSKDYKTNKPVITVFARSYLNHKVTKQFQIKHIKPYFYALNQTVQYDKSLYRVIEGDWVIDALGRRVQQTYCQLPSDIPKIREYYEITDEADIMFDKRYLIDNNISYTFTENEGVLSSCDVDSIQAPRTMWFDIEVRSPSNVMPKVINPIYPIVSIQIMDSYSKRIIVITNGVPKVADDQIACDSEKELYEVFHGVVQKIDPDILSGWYCIPEDTYIETTNGFTKIKDVDIDDELDTTNVVINKVNTGFKQCRRITTSLGNEFTTSNEHKFLVTNPKYTYVNNTCERYDKTWKNAIDLSNTDILSMPFGKYVNNIGVGLDTHKCYIMGLIYGDGSIKDKYRFSLYNKDMDLIRLSNRPYWYSKGCYITTFLRKEFETESALIVKDGYKKELNIEMISRLSLEEFCAFISGWIDSDGTFDSHTLTIADTRYKPEHSLLMKDFGILTSIHKCNYELNNEIHTCYKQRIMCALPIVWELIRKYSLYHYDTYIERLPSCKSKTKLSHFKYTFSENLDMVYVKVRSNTDCGYYKCCDIETSKHEFSIGCIVHNCNGFDLPYIILRAIRLNIDTRKLGRSDSQQCYAKQGNKAGNDFTERWSISVPGRQCFDLLDAFKKYYAPKGGLDAYDLKSVISNDKVMGGKAFRYTDYGGSIDSLFTTCQWDIFLQYCRYDVIALDTIDTELKLIEFYEQLRKTSGVKLEETLLNSRVIESMIMRAGIKPMPTKNYRVNITESFEGAVVLTPPVGIHKNVGVVDLAALYPNIIVGFNISPDIDGVIPRVIKTVMEERDVLRRLKNEGKADSVMKNKEQVLKFLANSFYGVLGWTKFRLYNIEQAAFITRTGRELNGFLQQIAMDDGYRVLYGDTDSIFINEFDTVSEGYEFEKLCNVKLEQWSRDKGSTVNFTLKFEKLYRTILFKKAVSGKMAKKRYAGHLIFKDGQTVNQLDMTGGETRRSDQSEITKGMLMTFLTKLLLEDKKDEALKDIKILVRDILRGKVSLHKLSIPKGVKDVNRNDPWNRGVSLLQKQFKINIPEGKKARLIYIKHNSPPELCIYEDVDEDMIKSTFDIDYTMCMKKTVEKKMRTYIESIGESWEGVVLGQKTFW